MRAARVHQGLGSSTLLLHGGTRGLSSARGVRRRRRRKGLPRGHLETTWEPCGTLGVAQAEGDIMELGVGQPHTQFFFPLPAGPKPLLQHGDLGVPAFGPVGSPLEQPLAPCLGPRPHASTTGAFETPDPGVAASEELLDLLPKPSEARPAAVVERRLRHGEENRISGVFNGARCSELLSCLAQLEVPDLAELCAWLRVGAAKYAWLHLQAGQRRAGRCGERAGCLHWEAPGAWGNRAPPGTWALNSASEAPRPPAQPSGSTRNSSALALSVPFSLRCLSERGTGDTRAAYTIFLAAFPPGVIILGTWFVCLCVLVLIKHQAFLFF